MRSSRLIKRTITTENGIKAGQLAEVSKRDFNAIAAICCETGAPRVTAERLAGYFKTQNPRFDRERFLRATESCRD